MNLDVALSVLLSFSAACYVALGLRMVAARQQTGQASMGPMLIIIGIWVVGGAIELVANSLGVFMIGRSGHFVGTALIPIVCYYGFREYTGRTTPMHRMAWMLVVPCISIGLAATNLYHEFMWYLPASNAQGEFLTRPLQWGPWFLFVHAPYSYGVMGIAAFILMAHGSAVAKSHRRGLFLLLAACAMPVFATVLYDLGFGPDTISFVPIVLTAVLPFYAWLIMSEQIVEFTPLAYETVFQNMQDPVVIVDDQGRVIGLNHGAEQLLSMTETSALFAPLKHVIGPDSPEVFEALATGEPRKMMTKTGRFMHVQVSDMQPTKPVSRSGKVLMFRDVSDVEKAQAEVRASERLLRTLIDHSVNGIMRFRWVDNDSGGSRELRCIFSNASAGRFLGHTGADLLNCRGDDMIRMATNAMAASDSQQVLGLFRAATESGDSIDTEVHLSSSDGARWLRMICEPFANDIAVTLVDITDSKARERRMESMASSDPLTGVLNRRGFEKDAAQRLTESDDAATGALLFIDLNGFKIINDSHGHEIGDQLLMIAAKRLRKSLRTCDIIGRPGGDEFVALVPDVSPGVADQLAKRLAASLEEPYLIGSEKLYCAASIGLALYPDNANTLTGLMREADRAMYRAKARSRDATNLRSVDLLEKAC